MDDIEIHGVGWGALRQWWSMGDCKPCRLHWKNITYQNHTDRLMYGLLTKCEVKMAGYWPSPFLRIIGIRADFNWVTIAFQIRLLSQSETVVNSKPKPKSYFSLGFDLNKVILILQSLQYSEYALSNHSTRSFFFIFYIYTDMQGFRSQGATQAASLVVCLKYKEMYGRILKSLIYRKLIFFSL